MGEYHCSSFLPSLNQEYSTFIFIIIYKKDNIFMPDIKSLINPIAIYQVNSYYLTGTGAKTRNKL